jgi:CHASE1-domain containing sensor protein
MSDGEDKRDRFERLAEKRTNAVLKKLDILANCANRNRYEYNEEDIEKIFKTIRKKVRETQSEFKFEEEDFSL